MGRAKLANKRCRLIGFNFSVTTNFILEFGDKYIRFWANGVQVLKEDAAAWVTAKAYAIGDYVTNAGGVYYCIAAHTSAAAFATDAAKWYALADEILEVPTPYLEADLRSIQYCQINDIMYLVHPDYPVHKLIRKADADWVMAELVFKWPALLDENITAITIDPSAATGNITLTASADIFSVDDVGSTWQLGYNMAGNTQTWVEVALGATTANSPAIRVRGPWSLTTYGSWKGEVRIVRTIFRTGVSETIRTYHNTVDGQRNVSTTGAEDEDCNMLISFITAGSAGTSNPTARLEFANAKVYGLVKITAFTDARHVNGTVIWSFSNSSTPTVYWSKAAFSKGQGYPRTVCLHEQRLNFGGTRKRPLSIWGSGIDDFEDFQTGVNADDAYFFTISSNESNPINWMVSQTKMLIGTAGDEWAMGAKDEAKSIGAGNVNVKQQSAFGSAYMQAEVVNEVILFSQRQSRKVRELVYSFEKDGWVAPDLSVLASHIAGRGFVETAFAQQPDAILWCVNKDGQLVGMTYERDQNVVGWHRHSTEGTFESVATIYGGEDADEVWVSVKRHVNGLDVRYIERLSPDFRANFEAEDKNNYWYLDCAKRTVSETDITIITGLEHLEGKTVGVLGDGANQPTRVVTSGQITIQEPAKNILVGLPYTSTVRPMNLNIISQDTMQGRKVRIHEMAVRIYKTLAMEFSSDSDEWNEIFFRDRADHMDDSPAPFSGDKRISTGATFSAQQAISIRQRRPLPCCLLAQILWCDFYGI